MNERYLFRAKRIDNGEWVEGALFDGEKHCVIGHTIKFSPYIQNECKIIGHKVYRDTICQCTGLRDKYGKLISEHEIVRECHAECIGEVKFGVHEKGYGWYIEWISEGSKFYCVDFLYWQKEVSLEVIGNIFDNPELLEQEG